MFEVLEMKRLRYKQKKKLNKPNKLLFDNMTMHIFNSTITYKEKEIALQQILDILLQAQQEHRSGEIVFQNPYKFCIEIKRLLFSKLKITLTK